MIYKGYEIDKFFQGEGKTVPNHVISEYYRTEKQRIDRIIKAEKNRSKHDYTDIPTIEESLNDFFDFIEEV